MTVKFINRVYYVVVVIQILLYFVEISFAKVTNNLLFRLNVLDYRSAYNTITTGWLITSIALVIPLFLYHPVLLIFKIVLRLRRVIYCASYKIIICVQCHIYGCDE